ncbi:MAG: AMP-binding protein [Clostridia bacterium]|nr:AMP-binding protein [Clostridia bacterium]
MADEQYRDLRELLNKTANKYSDEVAFKIKYRDEIVGVKYSKFVEDVKAFGAYLTTLNMDKKRIAFISPNRYEWCVTYMAVATSNMISVPLDRALPENEFTALVERSEAEVLVYDNKYAEAVSNMKENKNINVKYYINMDTDLNKCITDGKVILTKKDCKYNKIKIDSDKMKFMLFTSGTTSASKCVMLSHRNICSNIESITKTLDLTKDDILLSFLPLHHTFECTAGFLYPISVGAKIAYCDGIRHFQKNLVDYGVTALINVPIMLENVYKNIWKQIEKTKKERTVKVALKSSEALLMVGIDVRKTLFKSVHEALGGKIRLIVCGAAGIQPVVAKGFNDFGITLYQGYGLTETSPVVAVENFENAKNGSVGKALPKVEVKIDEPDHEGIGEIWVKGPNVMLGYYNDEENTKAVMKGGWFRTGDLGKIDDEGFIFITGRKKDVIVLKNGKNVFPQELEALVNDIDFVKESFVYGDTDETGDVTLKVKIVYDKEAVIEELGIMQDSELQEYFMEKVKVVNKKMPTYKYIRDVMITDEELIKTTTRKIKRHEELAKIGKSM